MENLCSKIPVYTIWETLDRAFFGVSFRFEVIFCRDFGFRSSPETFLLLLWDNARASLLERDWLQFFTDALVDIWEG